MKPQETLREIQLLRKKVHLLSTEMEYLKATWLEDASPVERLLKARGIKILRMNPADRLFFPPGFAPFHRTRFYEMMKRYSFRLVVRDMIKHQDRFDVEDLIHYCSPKTAKACCDALSEMGLIVPDGEGHYRTSVSPLFSFGPTLEWFIAEVFKRDLASPAIYGVHVKKTPSGGDYDVTASWNRRLIYVEVKSSPPKGVEQREVTTFFSRIDDLLPDVAILFNDTQLRMKDKLVVLCEEALERRYGKDSTRRTPVERLIEELFHIQHRIYIINSKKDVAENLTLCLRDHLQHGGPP